MALSAVTDVVSKLPGSHEGSFTHPQRHKGCVLHIQEQKGKDVILLFIHLIFSWGPGKGGISAWICKGTSHLCDWEQEGQL